MAITTNPQLKVNWFPVQVPDAELQLNAYRSDDRTDFREFRNVRQYRHDNQWLAVCVDNSRIPTGFVPTSLHCRELPMLTSTLIAEAIANHYERQKFVLERGKGQNAVYRPRTVVGLPDSITFYEGLLFKPFYIIRDELYTFGIVIDYYTHQTFNKSIEQDDIQRDLALGDHEVHGAAANGNFASGRMIDIVGTDAIVKTRYGKIQLPLASLRVKANYRSIRDYAERSQGGSGKPVIRALQVESLSLLRSGFANVNRLKDRYDRIALLLSRNNSASINVMLPTLCQSIISLATEPSDLEIGPA
jgi:hypothetical protein